MKQSIPIVVLIYMLSALTFGCATIHSERTNDPGIKSSLDVSGLWQGSLLTGPTTTLNIGFTVSTSSEEAYTAMMQIPSQGIINLPVSSVTVDKTLLTIEIEPLQASFVGSYDRATETITGLFSQMGQELVLVLSRGEVQTISRYQDPKKPYPYIAEEITFHQTPEGFLLAGTITRPQGEGPFPSVVLVSGSGAQDRDEALMGHRPFLVLSDALTRSGVVVLRYDDRGFAQSQGDASEATTLDLALDAESAVQHLMTLPYVDKENIGIVGHSEGAIIGPIVAQRNKDVDFLVLMAGTGVDGMSVLKDQTAAILRAQQIPDEVITQTVNANMAIYNTVLDESKPLQERKESILERLLSMGFSSPQAQSQISALFSPWYMSFLTLDPSLYLQKTDIPVMILNGSKDTQVSATLNVPAIEKALLAGRNTRFTTKVYEGLNHLFQPALTGSPEEYGMIETTIETVVLEDIATWIATGRFQL